MFNQISLKSQHPDAMVRSASMGRSRRCRSSYSEPSERSFARQPKALCRLAAELATQLRACQAGSCIRDMTRSSHGVSRSVTAFPGEAVNEGDVIDAVGR
jgi:hypothetical protein